MEPLNPEAFLTETQSPERWKTYQDLAGKDPLKRSADQLYALNLSYSRELYVILAGVEISLRNRLHQRLSAFFGRESWFERVKLEHKHQEDLDKAINYLSHKMKSNYVIGDLVSELNFGFWVHLLDRPYEQKFWNPVFSRAFPAKTGKPDRIKTEQGLKKLVQLRNKIAHLEPIIKREQMLLDNYRFALEFISWVCPETSKWFEAQSNFISLWSQNGARLPKEGL